MPAPFQALALPFPRAGVVALATAFAIVLGGSTLDAHAAAKDDTLESVIRLVQERYVTPISRETAVDMALSGLMLMLDDHSSFLTPKEFVETQQQAKGHYGGIGIRTERRDGTHYVAEVGENMPAARAGMQVGDKILAVAGLDAATLTQARLVEHVRGKAGSFVTLEWSRDDESFVAPMAREEIHTPTVKSALQPVEGGGNALVVRLTGFTSTTATELRSALVAHGAQPTQLILDLRNNPGGVLEAAVDVASLFLPPKRVVLHIRSRDKSERVMKTKAPQRLEKGLLGWVQAVPIAVLINSRSASAAEILAGALRDHGRATLVGNKNTRGKGTIQTVFELKGQRAVKMTVAQYILPHGEPVDRTGIAPQVWVATPSSEVETHDDLFSRKLQPSPDDSVLATALQTLVSQAADIETTTHAAKHELHTGSVHTTLRHCRLADANLCSRE